MQQQQIHDGAATASFKDSEEEESTDNPNSFDPSRITMMIENNMAWWRLLRHFVPRDSREEPHHFFSMVIIQPFSPHSFDQFQEAHNSALQKVNNTVEKYSLTMSHLGQVTKHREEMEKAREALELEKAELGLKEKGLDKEKEFAQDLYLVINSVLEDDSTAMNEAGSEYEHLPVLPPPNRSQGSSGFALPAQLSLSGSMASGTYGPSNTESKELGEFDSTFLAELHMRLDSIFSRDLSHYAGSDQAQVMHQFLTSLVTNPPISKAILDGKVTTGDMMDISSRITPPATQPFSNHHSSQSHQSFPISSSHSQYQSISSGSRATSSSQPDSQVAYGHAGPSRKRGPSEEEDASRKRQTLDPSCYTLSIPIPPQLAPPRPPSPSCLFPSRGPSSSSDTLLISTLKRYARAQGHDISSPTGSSMDYGESDGQVSEHSPSMPPTFPQSDQCSESMDMDPSEVGNALPMTWFAGDYVPNSLSSGSEGLQDTFYPLHSQPLESQDSTPISSSGYYASQASDQNYASQDDWLDQTDEFPLLLPPPSSAIPILHSSPSTPNSLQELTSNHILNPPDSSMPLSDQASNSSQASVNTTDASSINFTRKTAGLPFHQYMNKLARNQGWKEWKEATGSQEDLDQDSPTDE